MTDDLISKTTFTPDEGSSIQALDPISSNETTISTTPGRETEEMTTVSPLNPSVSPSEIIKI